jgi:hypothetical protein
MGGEGEGEEGRGEGNLKHKNLTPPMTKSLILEITHKSLNALHVSELL